MDFDSFGDYWTCRDTTTFSTTLLNNILTITIPNIYLPLNNMLSFVIDKGQLLESIVVQDENNNAISVQQANWGTNSTIIYLYSTKKANANNTANDIKHETNANLLFSCSNYPNPFKDFTYITTNLPKNGDVKLDVFDFLGSNVKSLSYTNLSKGNSQIIFDAKDLESGIYFYKLTFENQSIVNKMIICK